MVTGGHNNSLIRSIFSHAKRSRCERRRSARCHIRSNRRTKPRYARRMLRALDIETAPGAAALIRAVQLLRDGERHDSPRTFLRPASKWRRHLDERPASDRKLWEVAVLFHLRDALRSGEVWLPHSRRHADPTRALVAVPVAAADAGLAVPDDAREWIADRRTRMTAGLDRLAHAARTEAIPGGAIRDGGLNIERLAADRPTAPTSWSSTSTNAFPTPGSRTS